MKFINVNNRVVINLEEIVAVYVDASDGIALMLKGDIDFVISSDNFPEGFTDEDMMKAIITELDKL